MDSPLALGTVLPKPPSPDAVAEAAARVIAASGSEVGSCERCGERYTVTESGRIAEHVCADRVAAIENAGVPAVVELKRPRRVNSWDDDYINA